MTHPPARGEVTDPDYRRKVATADVFSPHAAPVVDGSASGHIHARTKEAARFTALPDHQTLAATIVALEEHGLSIEVVDDLDAARKGRIPWPKCSSSTPPASIQAARSLPSTT